MSFEVSHDIEDMDLEEAEQDPEIDMSYSIEAQDCKYLTSTRTNTCYVFFKFGHNDRKSDWREVAEEDLSLFDIRDDFRVKIEDGKVFARAIFSSIEVDWDI